MTAGDLRETVHEFFESVQRTRLRTNLYIIAAWSTGLVAGLLVLLLTHDTAYEWQGSLLVTSVVVAMGLLYPLAKRAVPAWEERGPQERKASWRKRFAEWSTGSIWRLMLLAVVAALLTLAVQSGLDRLH